MLHKSLADRFSHNSHWKHTPLYEFKPMLRFQYSLKMQSLFCKFLQLFLFYLVIIITLFAINHRNSFPWSVLYCMTHFKLIISPNSSPNIYSGLKKHLLRSNHTSHRLLWDSQTDNPYLLKNLHLSYSYQTNLNTADYFY